MYMYIVCMNDGHSIAKKGCCQRDSGGQGVDSVHTKVQLTSFYYGVFMA